MNAQRIAEILQTLIDVPERIVLQSEAVAWREEWIEQFNKELKPFKLEIGEGSDDRGDGTGVFFICLI